MALSLFPAAFVFQAQAAPAVSPGGEANLVLPDLASQSFLGMTGRELLMIGLLVCLGGLIFGLLSYQQLKRLPVHRAMREISELIYETCKTYLYTQARFILLLELFIGAIMVIYFGVLRDFPAGRVAVIILFSLIASRAAPASPGSESGSTPSPIRGAPSPV